MISSKEVLVLLEKLLCHMEGGLIFIVTSSKSWLIYCIHLASVAMKALYHLSNNFSTYSWPSYILPRGKLKFSHKFLILTSPSQVIHIFCARCNRLKKNYGSMEFKPRTSLKLYEHVINKADEPPHSNYNYSQHIWPIRTRAIQSIMNKKICCWVIFYFTWLGLSYIRYTCFSLSVDGSLLVSL